MYYVYWFNSVFKRWEQYQKCFTFSGAKRFITRVLFDDSYVHNWRIVNTKNNKIIEFCSSVVPPSFEQGAYLEKRQENT